MASRSLVRRVCLILALALGFPVLLVELGTFVPQLPVIGAVGTIVTGCFTLHVTLAAVAATVLAFGAVRAASSRRARFLLAANAILVAFSLVPIALLLSRAHQSQAPISWWSHLRIARARTQPSPQTREYASIGGKSLLLDIYAASGGARGPAPPLVMIHGGGFVYGKRSDGRDWDQWFAERGYAVFDIDYRLAPPETWNLAAADVACALAWIKSHAGEFNIDIKRSVVVGQSAGASLALQATYGLHDGSLKSSCDGEADPEPPIAAFALYPVEDFELAWNKDPKIGFLTMRRILVGYIGGSPAQFPNRYHAVSPIEHIGAGLPPTLIAYGNHDHVVPVNGHQVFAATLTKSGVPNGLIEIPWSDHGYDLAWGSLGGQITRHELSTFLARYAPTTPPGDRP